MTSHYILHQGQSSEYRGVGEKRLLMIQSSQGRETGRTLPEHVHARSRCGIKEGILWRILPEITVFVRHGHSCRRCWENHQCGQEQNREAWQTLGTTTPSQNTRRLWSQSFQELLNKFEIWWPCESTPHINPVTHNFFMSTGMLCEQNNVFLHWLSRVTVYSSDQCFPHFLLNEGEWWWHLD